MDASNSMPQTPDETQDETDALQRAHNIEIVARTIWGEMRGEGQRAMTAVANVVMNRARHPRWWGGPSPASVCLARLQFSCWNVDDPNCAKLKAVTEYDAVFRDALEIARKAVDGELVDFTNNADSYHDEPLSAYPSWARGVAPCFVLGAVKFYRLELAAPGTTTVVRTGGNQ